MPTNIDVEIKAIKENRAYGLNHGYQPFGNCERCGMKFYVGLPSKQELEADEDTNNGEQDQPYCYACIIDITTNHVPVVIPTPKETICRYCRKKRKLIGAWCRTCRNNSQRKEIKLLLSEKISSYDKKLALLTYEKSPIWRKEFHRIKL